MLSFTEREAFIIGHTIFLFFQSIANEPESFEEFKKKILKAIKAEKDDEIIYCLNLMMSILVPSLTTGLDRFLNNQSCPSTFKN